MAEVVSGVREIDYSTVKPGSLFLLEWVGGIFGLLGLGYIYVGRTQEGLVRLVWWVFWLTAVYILIYALPTRVIAVCVCLPVHLVAQVMIPFWLANRFRKQML
jgi:hypothetical protein